MFNVNIPFIIDSNPDEKDVRFMLLDIESGETWGSFYSNEDAMEYSGMRHIVLPPGTIFYSYGRYWVVVPLVNASEISFARRKKMVEEYFQKRMWKFMWKFKCE